MAGANSAMSLHFLGLFRNRESAHVVGKPNFTQKLIRSLFYVLCCLSTALFKLKAFHVSSFFLLHFFFSLATDISFRVTLLAMCSLHVTASVQGSANPQRA